MAKRTKKNDAIKRINRDLTQVKLIPNSPMNSAVQMQIKRIKERLKKLNHPKIKVSGTECIEIVCSSRDRGGKILHKEYVQTLSEYR